MARRYSRREFLTDASFTFATSVLLKVLAPTNHLTDGDRPVEQAEWVEKAEGVGPKA